MDGHVIVPAAVIAASLVRRGGEEDAEAAAGSGVEDLLAQAAQQVAATREFTDQDVDDAASMMAQMSGIEPDGGRRCAATEEQVSKLLARHD